MLIYQNATIFVLTYFFRFHLFITLIIINYFRTTENELNAYNFVKYQDTLIIFVAIYQVNIWLVEPANNSKPDIWYIFKLKDTFALFPAAFCLRLFSRIFINVCMPIYTSVQH